MPVWMLCLPVLFPILAGAVMLARPIEDRKKRQIYVAGAVIVNAVLALTVLIWTPDGVLTLLRFSDTMQIALQIDGAGRVFGILVSLLWPLTTFYSFEYMKHEGRENKFFGFFTMTFGVIEGVAFADNFLTLYLFYELLTLATLPLVMHSMDGRARYAGKKYLIYSLSGAAFAFIAMIFLLTYGSTLDFTFGGVLDPSRASGHETLLQTVFVLGFFGFGVKAAIFPFHGWLPDASVAPTPVSALLHAGGSGEGGRVRCDPADLLWFWVRFFARQLGADGGDDGGCRNDCIRFRHGAAHPPFETAAGLFHRQ